MSGSAPSLRVPALPALLQLRHWPAAPSDSSNGGSRATVHTAAKQLTTYQSSSISCSEYVAVLWSANATARVHPTAMMIVHATSSTPGFSPTTHGACTILMTNVEAASGAATNRHAPMLFRHLSSYLRQLWWQTIYVWPFDCCTCDIDGDQ